MPNVAPRGLYGCVAGTFRPAVDVFAVIPGQSTYTRAKYVWVWCGDNDTGGWQVVWGSEVSAPISPAAVYVTNVTNVAVTWTLPSPNVSNGWIVRRPDGSVVGTVQAAGVQLTDQSPLPGSGAYTVAGVDSQGNESAAVATNSLTISLQPATATATLSGGNVVVAWTPHATQGDPDTWAIWNATDNAWAVSGLAPATRSYTVTGLTPGKSYTFAVYPYLSGAQATGRSTAAVGVPALEPTSVAMAAINPPAVGNASADQLQLTWATPAGVVTGYEVQSSTNGTAWTAVADNTSPSVIVSTVPAYMRVRSLSAGGASGWVQKGPVTPYPDAPANVPGSVTLVATNPPLSNLRLTWTAPSGSLTGYEVQTSTNGSTWAASADNTTPADWSTTVAGYMRVRTLSAGGPSAWVQRGPVTPVNDVTPPPAATITSFKPESSYGRLVVRGNWNSSSDVAKGQIYYRIGSGSYVSVWGATAVTPGAAYGVAVFTGTAGQVVTVLVRTWDDAGNYSDKTAAYTLAATPTIIDPTDSATWRTDEWRTDSVAGSTGVMHGRTSSGENKGCWFYGTAINDFCKAHDVVSATVEYCRDGSSQGSSAAIQPQIWVHQHATQPATAPLMGAGSTVVLGSGVARSGTTGGSANLSTSLIDALGASYYGIGVYRATSNSNDADAASFYMRLYPFKTNSGGKISGRVTLNHLG